MTKYSRSQWAQITKHVKRANFRFTAWKCLICGLKFTNGSCLHSVQENEAAIQRVREELSEQG